MGYVRPGRISRKGVRALRIDRRAGEGRADARWHAARGARTDAGRAAARVDPKSVRRDAGGVLRIMRLPAMAGSSSSNSTDIGCWRASRAAKRCSSRATVTTTRRCFPRSRARSRRFRSTNASSTARSWCSTRRASRASRDSSSAAGSPLRSISNGPPSSCQRHSLPSTSSRSRISTWRPLSALAQRKALMLGNLPKLGPVRILDHIEREGERFLTQVTALGLEGIIAKRADSRYIAGRTDAWLKIKAARTGDFVIVGFTEGKGSRQHFGALQLADMVGGTLVYAGRAGTGFGRPQQLGELKAMLDPIVRADAPCFGPSVEPGATPLPSEDIPDVKTTTWVEPRYVCEVQFGEWTPDGLLRHPAFLRMRPDKAPHDCDRQGWSTASVAAEPAPGVPERYSLHRRPRRPSRRLSRSRTSRRFTGLPMASRRAISSSTTGPRRGGCCPTCATGRSC